MIAVYYEGMVRGNGFLRGSVNVDPATFSYSGYCGVHYARFRLLCNEQAWW